MFSVKFMVMVYRISEKVMGMFMVMVVISMFRKMIRFIYVFCYVGWECWLGGLWYS